MTVEQRLEKLEQELSRANRRNRRLLGGIILCLGIGFVVWTFRPGVATAQQTGAAIDEVRAKRFIVVDEEGDIRGIFGTNDGGDKTAILLYDEEDRLRIGLHSGGQGAALGLTLLDENEVERVNICAYETLSGVNVFDEDGLIRTSMTGDNAFSGIHIGSENEQGASFGVYRRRTRPFSALAFVDKDGGNRLLLGAGGEHSKIGLYDDSGVPRAVIEVLEGVPTIRANDKAGAPAWIVP